jgi:hypothetical protein
MNVAIISNRELVEVNILRRRSASFESDHQKEVATSLAIDLSSEQSPNSIECIY